MGRRRIQASTGLWGRETFMTYLRIWSSSMTDLAGTADRQIQRTWASDGKQAWQEMTEWPWATAAIQGYLSPTKELEMSSKASVAGGQSVGIAAMRLAQHLERVGRREGTDHGSVLRHLECQGWIAGKESVPDLEPLASPGFSETTDGWWLVGQPRRLGYLSQVPLLTGSVEGDGSRISPRTAQLGLVIFVYGGVDGGFEGREGAGEKSVTLHGSSRGVAD